MIIFENLKNQSHRFMTIFRNFFNQGETNRSQIKTLRCFGLRSSALASKTEATTKWINEDFKCIKQSQIPVSGNYRVY